MRPVLFFAPRGQVPASLTAPLAAARVDVFVASDVGEAAALLDRERPDVVLVVPPATTVDAAPLLPHVERQAEPPPIFVLTGAGAPGRPVALEAVSVETWRRAAEDLDLGSGGAASALLLSRVQLAALLGLRETLPSRPEGTPEEALRTLSHLLDASRVSLVRWEAGEAHAVLVASSLGSGPAGRELEIARYPELRAAAVRSGPLLVEEVGRDPLMDEASRWLVGVPIRSLVCQRLPCEAPVFLHAVRERSPFGLTDVALFRAAARILAASAASVPRPAAREAALLRAMALPLGATSDAIAVLDAAGEVLLANAALGDLTGRCEAELVGHDHREFLRSAAPGDEPASGAASRAWVVTLSPDSVPVEVLHTPAPPEGPLPHGWSVVTFFDRRGAAAARAREEALGRELSEALARIGELERLRRESGLKDRRFWSAAAHELRTPLAILKSHLEVVTSDLASEIPERPAGFLRTALENLSRLERVIADTMDGVAGLERKGTGPGDLDLARLLRRLGEEFSGQAAKRKVELRVDAPEALPSVAGDPDRAERLIANLLQHALRAAPRTEPVVRLEAREEEGGVAVSVVDHGPPVDAGSAARLFEEGDFGLTAAGRLARALGVELRAERSPEGANVTRALFRRPVRP